MRPCVESPNRESWKFCYSFTKVTWYVGNSQDKHKHEGRMFCYSYVYEYIYINAAPSNTILKLLYVEPTTLAVCV